jgi:hypothetical protein
MRIEPDKIVWDREDFMAGLVPDFTNGVCFGAKGAAYMESFNPLSWSPPGIAYPGFLATSLSGVTAGPVPDAVLVDAAVDDTGTNGYALGGNKLHQITTGFTVLNTAGSWPHTIAGAGVHAAHNTFTGVLGSVVQYNVSGLPRTFYSYGDNIDWDVGTVTPGGTFDDDFMTSVPTTPLGTTAADLTDGQGKPHPLYPAADGILYEGSGRFVHSYDGPNNTFYSRVLDLPIGYDITGFAEDGTDLVSFGTTGRGTAKRATARAFWWSADRPASYYKEVKLDDNDVSCPFNYNGTMGCFTRNRSNKSVLRLWDGTGFVPKFYWTGSLPTVGGAEIWNNMVLWNSDGKMYGWGSFKGEYPEGAFQLMSGSGTTSGFLKNLTGTTLYASSGTGTNGGLQSFGNFGTGLWTGLTAIPEFGLGKRGRIRSVQGTFTAASSGGRSLSLYLTAEGGVAKLIQTITSITAANTTLRWDPENFTDNLEQFNLLRPELIIGAGSGSSDAIPLEKIEVFYEPISYTKI